MAALIYVLIFTLLSSTNAGKPSVVEDGDKSVKGPVDIYNAKPDMTDPEEDEMKDMHTEWREDGTAQFNFTSHGKRYELELRESKYNLSSIPIRLLGSSKEREEQVTKQWQNLKLMRDRRGGAAMIFRKDDDKLNRLEGGLFRRGKHDYGVKRSTSGPPKAVKISQVAKYDFGQGKAKSVNGKRRDKRSAVLPYDLQPVQGNVELVWIIDYSVVTSFTNLVGSKISNLINDTDPIVNLMTYYAQMTGIMDDFYGTLNNDYLEVTVDLAGMVILDSPTELSHLVEDYESDGEVDGLAALIRLKDWLASSESSGVVPPYDHVMLSTAYDMSDTGYSEVERICNSASVVETSRSYTFNAAIATHALARSLGADNDGTGTSDQCRSDGYILGTDYAIVEFLFLFSCCAQRAIYSNLHRNGYCLTVYQQNPNYNISFDENVEAYLPGEVFNADDQCYIQYGTEECSDSEYIEAGTNVCSRLCCVSPDDPDATIFNYQPVDGTSCGPTSWCIQSACIENSVESRGPILKSCDVSSCIGAELQCSEGVNLLEPERFRCYSDEYRCDSIEDCSDGSDESGCQFTPIRSCPRGYYMCASGINQNGKPDGANRYCVEQDYVCDGNSDCSDSSDENGCTCSAGYFRCTAGENQQAASSGRISKCVESSSVCDGVGHCTDSSDEDDCSNRAGCFVCSSGFCAISTVECDLYCLTDSSCNEHFNDGSGTYELISNALLLSSIVSVSFLL